MNNSARDSRQNEVLSLTQSKSFFYHWARAVHRYTTMTADNVRSTVSHIIPHFEHKRGIHYMASAHKFIDD